MTHNRRAFRQMVRTAVLLATASAATLASQGPVFRVDPPMPLCYCHCAHESGTKHCTKMCELPQYQKRWWAISCSPKKGADESKSSAPAAHPGSKKTNRTEQASL